jgi:hypothetical protein
MPVIPKQEQAAFSKLFIDMKKYCIKVCKTDNEKTLYANNYRVAARGATLNLPLDYLNGSTYVVELCREDKAIAGFVVNGNSDNLRYFDESILSPDKKKQVLGSNDLRLDAICEITCLYSMVKLNGFSRFLYYGSMMWYLWKLRKIGKSILVGGSYIKGIRQTQKDVLPYVIWTYFVERANGKSTLVEIYYGKIGYGLLTKVGYLLTKNMMTLMAKRLTMLF